jgi:hypothetical protein
MIESALAFNPATTASDDYNRWVSAGKTNASRMKSVMRYDVNDRTAGPIPVFGTYLARENILAAGNAYAPVQNEASVPNITSEGEDKGYSFGDVIDMINPLQHLPVIGSIYRKMTGDELKPMSEIIGGAVFGGPVGAVASTVNVVVKDRTGKGMAENAMSLFTDQDTGSYKAPPEILAGPMEQEQLAGTTLAVANLSIARDGRHNFAAKPRLFGFNN